ncbi:hypothetical protein J6P52_04170 [bacterium]|nr:hypothetical protein [bacterium]
MGQCSNKDHSKSECDHHSNQKNPNNHEHKDENNNHSNQLNPNNKEYKRNK